ncbi:O-methyltransferase [Bacteroides togonis]|uniref:O-methyltransferase n=1 Tax=Bacteroides togonis TaxID=1917883 RepID=UPI00094B7133|nr:O-methyltransferase [Bacteroides togonis]
MKSPTNLNYEVRPCKFVERRMLLSAFMRIIPRFNVNYQYIGFGGLAFTDFKLFHRELHINTMYSIEGGYNEQKLEFNKPYSCIKILCGDSSNMLSSIDLSKSSIIWLDYDGCLTMDVFRDLEQVLMKIPHGSIYLMSCNRQLRKEKIPYSLADLSALFGNLVPLGLENDCCCNTKAPTTIKKMLEADCANVISDRNKTETSKLKFQTLFNLVYEEYRGARMYTFGGIVLHETFDEKTLNIWDLDFINTDEPYEVDIPNLTYREASALNQILNLNERESYFVDNSIIEKDEIERYKKYYKYLPNFYDVRI